MQAIADRAGVSKPTLYQDIGQKDAISSAVLDQGRATILASFRDFSGKDMVPVLWDFSWTYADDAADPDNLSIARLIINGLRLFLGAYSTDPQANIAMLDTISTR